MDKRNGSRIRPAGTGFQGLASPCRLGLWRTDRPGDRAGLRRGMGSAHCKIVLRRGRVPGRAATRTHGQRAPHGQADGDPKDFPGSPYQCHGQPEAGRPGDRPADNQKDPLLSADAGRDDEQCGADQDDTGLDSPRFIKADRMTQKMEDQKDLDGSKASNCRTAEGRPPRTATGASGRSGSGAPRPYECRARCERSSARSA